MALFKTSNAAGYISAPAPSDQSVIALRVEIASAGINLTTSDVLQICQVPPNMQVIDFVLDADSAAFGSAFTFNLGILKPDNTGISSGTNDTWVSASTFAQTGGISRMADAKPLRSGASTSNRSVGLVPTAAGASVAGKVFGLTLYLRAV